MLNALAVIQNYRNRISRSTQGNALVVYGNRPYAYRRVSLAEEIKNYRCVWCKVGQLREDLAGNLYIAVHCPANCQASEDHIMADRMAQACVEAYATTNEQNRLMLYNAALQSLQNDYPHGLVHFPAYETLRQRMRRARQMNMPPIPHDYAHVPDFNHFPEVGRVTASGEELFLFLSEVYQNPVNGNDEKIVVWASETDIQHMVAAGTETLFIDGTFSVCPEPFSQLVTILTSIAEGPGVNDRMMLVPRMYCLLPSKTAAVYTFLFERILARLNVVHHRPRDTLPWRYISLDFETGLIAALTALFPHIQNPGPGEYNVQLQGCEFHHAQCLYKQLTQVCHFLMAYRNEDNVLRHFLKLITSLVFLPEDRILACFEDIVANHVPAEYNNAQMQQFLDYVRHQWIDNEMNRHMANVFHRVAGRRTNNEVEGFHYALSLTFQRHEDLWSFTAHLRELQARYALQEQQVELGTKRIRLRRQQYRIQETQLQLLRNNYVNGHVYATDLAYIQAVSHHMAGF